MGLTEGGISFRTYHQTGDLPAQYRQEYFERIKHFTFRELDPEFDEDISHGWVPVGDMLGAFMGTADVYEYQYLMVSIRVDRWSVPGNLFKAECRREEERRLKEGSRSKLTRLERGEIHDEVWRELKHSALPKPTVADMAWNLKTGMVRLLSTSNLVNELFVELFERTFSLKLQAESPYVAVLRCDLDGDQLGALAELDHETLGTELGAFIWWLEEKLDEREKVYSDALQYQLDDKLVLVHGDNKTALSGGDVAERRDAKAALKMGATPTKMRITLTHEERDWSGTVDLNDFSFSSVKLPEGNRQADERALERADLLDCFEALWLELYKGFLTVRLSDQWGYVKSKMSIWKGQSEKAVREFFDHVDSVFDHADSAKVAEQEIQSRVQAATINGGNASVTVSRIGAEA